MAPSLRAKRPTTDGRLLVCRLDSGGDSRGFRPRFFCHVGSSQKRKQDRNGCRNRNRRRSRKEAARLARTSQNARKRAAEDFRPNAGRGEARGPRGGTSGLRRQSAACRHCPAPCRAMVASGLGRLACRLAGGASGGGVVKCALLRSNGENLALGGGLFSGLRRKDPDADSPAGLKRPGAFRQAIAAAAGPPRAVASLYPPQPRLPPKNSEERS